MGGIDAIWQRTEWMVPLMMDVLYGLAIFVASPWLLYAAIFKGKYRAGWSQKLFGLLPHFPTDRPIVWCHAVSVGEVNVLATILPALLQRWPEYDYRVTTTTATGYQLARSRFPNCVVSYAPLDFSWAVRQAFRRWSPRILLLVELELWPNLIRAADQSKAQIIIVNGRLSEASFRGYARIRPFVAGWLRKIDCIAVQDESYADRFRQLGATRQTVVTGCVKFDSAETDRNNPITASLASLVDHQSEHVIFLAGSTQEPEEEYALATFSQLSADHPQLRLILVPRHPDRFDSVAKMIDRSGLAWVRRSNLSRDEPPPRWQVLLVDTVGELGHWWGLADIGFVGGSMGTRGGQNMIEPAAYGVAVSFGRNTKNFRDVTELLLAHRAAEVVPDAQALTDFVRKCLQDPSYQRFLADNARATVLAQRGALSTTINCLTPYF